MRYAHTMALPTLAHPEQDTISYEELRRRVAEGSLVVVDVLPRESWLAEHIPGALSLPLAELPERAATVLPVPTAQIAVYCGGPT